MSESIGVPIAVSAGTVGVKIAKALLAAQKNITAAEKDGSNPHFSSTFATVGSVIDAVKGPLNAEGISFLQLPAPTGGETLGITTMLIHESGEFIAGTAVVPLQKTDPQGYGSAMTYARRYSLASVVGLKTVDDDGEAAVGRSAAPVNNNRPAPSGFKLGGGLKPAAKASAPAKGKTGMFPKVAVEEEDNA